MAVWETLVEVFRDAAMLSVLLHCVHRVFHFDRWRPSIVLRRRLVEGIVDSLGISTDSPDSFSDSLMGDAEAFADFLLRSSIGNHHEDFPVVRREMHAEFLERSREFVVALGFYDDFGYKNANEYEKGASDVINNKSALYKTEAEDGDGVYYIEATNEFVILSTDGYIRTYFRPNGGKSYFDRQ